MALQAKPSVTAHAVLMLNKGNKGLAEQKKRGYTVCTGNYVATNTRKSGN
jgi:hypothetical protein